MRRVVCAANRNTFDPDLILLGPRHWDATMHAQADRLNIRDFGVLTWEEGFIDQRGEFLTRTEAWKVAEAAKQITRRCGGDEADGGTLYSENLY